MRGTPERHSHLQSVRDAVCAALTDGPLPFRAIRRTVEPSVPGCTHEDVKQSVLYLRRLGLIEPTPEDWGVSEWQLVPEVTRRTGSDAPHAGSGVS